MASSFFYIYVMATSFFYIYMIDIYIDIYKLTERPVVPLNAIFVAELSIFITMSDDKTKSQQRISIYFWGCRICCCAEFVVAEFVVC